MTEGRSRLPSVISQARSFPSCLAGGEGGGRTNSSRMEKMSKLDQALLKLGVLTEGEVQRKVALEQEGELVEEALLASRDTKEGQGAKEGQPAKEEQLTREDQLKKSARDLRVEFVDLSTTAVEKEIASLIPEAMAERYRILCIGKLDKKITLAMADPTDVFAIDDVRLRTGYDVAPVLADPDVIEKVRKQIYEKEESWKEMVGDAEEVMDVVKEEEVDEKKVVIDTPVIRLVNHLIYEAVDRKASDIHIEPFEADVIVRYRIDGVLHDIMHPPKSILPAVVSRVKIMSSLKIDEKRLPQDGRIQMRLKEKNRDLDIRVSTLPTLFGESVVMRLLDRANMRVSLEDLGFSPENFAKWKELISHPHGMILVTGPTGSGKSTTLYSTLNTLNSTEVKVVTIEDPVEYYLKGVNQVQVQPRIGLNFATGLRAFLRQDPDIMMVGEIRDKETATIAMESALTGHLVLSTLHTNTSIGAITRLVDMGIEPFLIGATVLGILAQRLVRLACSKCAEEVKELSEECVRVLQENGIPKSEWKLKRGRGCPNCNQTGYKGRMGIYELLVFSDAIRGMVVKSASEGELLDQARKEGLLVLFEDGIRKVAQGRTTFEELNRVTKEK